MTTATIITALAALAVAIWAAQLWFKGLTPADRARLENENSRLSAEAELLRDMLRNRQTAEATPKRQPIRRRNAA